MARFWCFLVVLSLLLGLSRTGFGQPPPPAKEPLPAGAVAKLGDTNWWHGRWIQGLEDSRPEQWIQGLEFAPGDRMLASYGRDDQVCLWDTQTGKLLHQLALTTASEPLPGGLAHLAAQAGE